VSFSVLFFKGSVTERNLLTSPLLPWKEVSATRRGPYCEFQNWSVSETSPRTWGSPPQMAPNTPPMATCTGPVAYTAVCRLQLDTGGVLSLSHSHSPLSLSLSHSPSHSRSRSSHTSLPLSLSQSHSQSHSLPLSLSQSHSHSSFPQRLWPALASPCRRSSCFPSCPCYPSLPLLLPFAIPATLR